MKSNIYLLGLVAILTFSLAGCKPKQSAYQAAYEAAKEREATIVEEVVIIEKEEAPAPVTNERIQTEKITAVDGDGIKDFSIVIGSFVNKTNATKLRSRMQEAGYKAFLAQNEKGMYRVIVATFADKASAAAERDRVKAKYAPEFDDIWILQQAK